MQIVNRKSIVTLAGLASIFLALGINSVLSESQQEVEAVKVLPHYPVVSVTQTVVLSHQASLTSYGEVTSRNQLSLTSQVNGQITYLSAKFLSGKTFDKGELIAEIEPIIYEKALAQAKAALAEASLALSQEKLNSTQAAEEWLQSGLAKEKASDLVLRKPQLTAARAKFEMANKDLLKAEYDLTQTKFIAPFDALVVSKWVQVGSNIQVGSKLAELYDINLFEVSVPLSLPQWQLLPSAEDELSDIQVILNDEGSSKEWRASVDRFEQHVDAQSRQRSLIAVIENPIELEIPLFPGTFVKATLMGRKVDQLWKLPASALIDSQTVWQVSDGSLLAPLKIDLVFSEGNYVYVRPVEPTSPAKVVNRPLSTYLVNMKVEENIEVML